MPTYTKLDPSTAGTDITISPSGLTASAPGAASFTAVRAFEGKTAGKWYFEFTVNDVLDDGLFGSIHVGVVGYRYGTILPNRFVGDQDFSTPSAARTGLATGSTGGWYGNNVGDGFSHVSDTWVAGDHGALAFDVTKRLAWFKLNTGSWNGNPSANPATGVGGLKFENNSGADSLTLGTRVWPAVSVRNTPDSVTLNFGASAFRHAPPTGYSGWTSTYSAVGDLAYGGYTVFTQPTLWVTPFTPATDFSLGALLINMVSSGPGHVRGVLFDSDGPGGVPGTLLDSTPVYSVNGSPGFSSRFNSQPIIAAAHKVYIGYITDFVMDGGTTRAGGTTGYTNGNAGEPGAPSVDFLPTTFPEPASIIAPAMAVIEGSGVFSPVFPIWTIEPDWVNGVTERLQWKTDVIRSQSADEQRRCLRASPRRQIEASFTLIDATRRLYDAYMIGPAASRWIYPLWWEKLFLASAHDAGSITLTCDTTDDTEIVAGSTIVLIDSDTPFIFEGVVVAEVTSGQLTLASPLVRDWPRGSSVYLTKQAFMQGTQNGKRMGDGAQQVTILFQSVEINDFDAVEPDVLPGALYPVLAVLPNEATDISVTYSRLLAEFDNQLSPWTPRSDLGGRSLVVQQVGLVLQGRAEMKAFRGFLYWLRGKLMPLYVPTYYRDVVPAQFAAATSTTLVIERYGYTEYILSADTERHLVGFYFHDGSVVLRTVASAEIISDQTERLTFTEALGRNVAEDILVRACFVVLSRQDLDEIEILHHTDASGAATVTTAFAAITDRRDASPYSTNIFTGSYVQSGDGFPPLPSNVDIVTDPGSSVFEGSQDGGSGGADGSGGGGDGGAGADGSAGGQA